MSRRLRIAGLALAIVALTSAALLFSFLRYGLSAHDEPSRMEAVAARTLRHWSAPSELRDVDNPLPFTPHVLAEARAHWADHCAVCHGNDGKGKTPIGEHLYPRAPDMTLRETQRLSDGELFAIIENGIRLTGMPGWGDGTAASGYGSWSLVHLIRRLPQITLEELDEMEKLNPKTPEEWAEQQAEEDFLRGEGAAASAPRENASQEHPH